MRFAYIDSQGTEVGIPSVEAFQLRIELGAITEDTMFYDQNADRWAPAGEHDVFRSLDREVRGRNEDVRPALPGTWSPAVEGDSAGLSSDSFAVATDGNDPPEAVADTEPTTDVSTSTPGSGAASPPRPGPGDLDFDLGGIGDFEVVTDFAEGSGSVMGWGQLPSDVVSDAAEDLELEVPLSEQGEAATFGDAFATDHLPPDPDVAAQDPFGHGTEVSGDPSEGLAAPMPHPFDEQDLRPGVEEGGDVRRSADPLRRDPYERRPRRPDAAPPKTRTLKRRTRSSGMSSWLTAAGIVALAGGGWAAWSILGGDQSALASEFEAVEIPDLPAELEIPMRQAAAVALAATFDSVRAMATVSGIPAEPNEDWLSGAYLANAGAYLDVLDYWETFRDYLSAVRDGEVKIFNEALRSTVDAGAISMNARDTVVARGEAGFLAMRAAREQVHGQLEELIEAATGLHDFLSVNQEFIDYEPASRISAEPVTEAIAKPAALNDEMWDRVLRITNALDALGTLDRVTTEKVLDVYMARLEPTGIR